MDCGNITISSKGNNNKKNNDSFLNNKNDRIFLSESSANRKKKIKDIMKKEMEKYQNIIKKQREFIKNIEKEEINESEDYHLKYMMRKKLGLKKKQLSDNEIVEGIKQDEKEEAKRKRRKAYFSPMKKEVPFRHR